MTEFDPAQPALVHDRVNDQMMEWSPDWRDNYRKYARPDAPGVVTFDGLLLDGWRPLLKVVPGSPMTEADADSDDRTSGSSMQAWDCCATRYRLPRSRRR
jgi:hypothetical protein